MSTVLDLDRIATLFHVTEKGVRGWITAGMPVVKRGTRGGAREKTQIDLEQAIDWYFGANVDSLELDRQRTRLASEQADKTALDNAARRKDLAPLSLIEREFGVLLAEIRTNALAIPSKVAPELEGQDCAERQATLERVVFELLDRAAGWSPGAIAASAGSAGAGAPEPEAPPDADGKPVGRRKAPPKS